MDGIKEYAIKMVCSGYQKETTGIQQQYASVFSVLYTQLIESEKNEKQPSAVYDYKTLKVLIYEKKVISGRE